MDIDVILMYKMAYWFYTSGSTLIPIYLYPYAQVVFNVFVRQHGSRLCPYAWNKKKICYAQQNLFMPLKKICSFYCQFAPFTPFAHLSTINTRNYKIDNIKNKAISMMRGKSPPSDVEMSKTEFRGGHLGFLAAILD